MADAVADATARGSVLGLATAWYWRSWAALSSGRLDDATAAARRALAATRHGWRVGEAGSHAVLASVHAARGRLREARRELEQGEESARMIPEVPSPSLRMACGQFELEHGSADKALAIFIGCGERLLETGATNPACAPWRSGAALANSRLGDHAETDRLLDEELDLARGFGAPAPIGWALYSRGQLLNGEGIELLREAADLLGEAGRPLDRARALTTLGGVLRRAGKRREAREPLREALDLAETSGATALAALARTETAAAGARPRRTALTGTESLTPRELQVAQLAAGGMSNRRIAEALFVTIKTVEWHLRHAYEKLGIQSREDLPRHLSGR